MNQNIILIRQQKGFTLIELIIYVGLLMVMLLLFTQILTTILEGQLRSTNTSNVADDGRYIYSRFIYDVGRADSIIEPALFGSSSANLTLVINGENHTYSTSSGNLVAINPSGTYNLNGYGSSISNLVFTKVGSDSAKDTVRISFTISGNIRKEGVADEQNFQTTAGLR